MKEVSIKNFEELESILKNWTSFGDPYVYDNIGIVTLFLACLDNIKKNFHEEELEDFKEYLTVEQKEFFLRLSNLLK